MNFCKLYLYILVSKTICKTNDYFEILYLVNYGSLWIWKFKNPCRFPKHSNNQQLLFPYRTKDSRLNLHHTKGNRKDHDVGHSLNRSMAHVHSRNRVPHDSFPLNREPQCIPHFDDKMGITLIYKPLSYSLNIIDILNDFCGI